MGVTSRVILYFYTIISNELLFTQVPIPTLVILYVFVLLHLPKLSLRLEPINTSHTCIFSFRLCLLQLFFSCNVSKSVLSYVEK